MCCSRKFCVAFFEWLLIVANVLLVVTPVLIGNVSNYLFAWEPKQGFQYRPHFFPNNEEEVGGVFAIALVFLPLSAEIIPAKYALFQYLTELRLLAKPARKFSADYERSNKAASPSLEFFVQTKPGDPSSDIDAIGFIIDVETMEKAENIARLCQEGFDLQDARLSIPITVHAFDFGASSSGVIHAPLPPNELVNYISWFRFHSGTPMDHILAKHGYAANDHDGPRPATFFARITEFDKDGNEIQKHLVLFVSDSGSLEKQLKIKMKG